MKVKALVFVASSVIVQSFIGAAADERRITNAANVRLRSTPSTTASIVAELPLGTEFVAVAHTNGSEPWYHVRTDDGRDGWVLGSLTTSIDIDHREKTIEVIVEMRLRRDGSFSDAVQLFDLIERTASRLSDPETQARFALYRMGAMNLVFHQFPDLVTERDVDGGNPRKEPFGSWVRAHRDAARYDEPGGSWMVDPDSVQAVHDRYRGTAAADDIAWFYVMNGLFGECEGSVPCYVEWQDRLNGWYLRSHPRGAHTDESAADIAYRLNGAMDNLLQFPAVLAEFNPQSGCRGLRGSLDSLIAAVTVSTSTKKAQALAALDRYAQLCK